MKTALILAYFLLFVMPVWAAPLPTTQTYPMSCTKLWPAVKSIVQAHYDVLSIDDTTHSGLFTTGTYMTGVRPLTFHLVDTGTSCTVGVTGHFSGLINNDKGDFFKRIQNELGSDVPPESLPQNAAIYIEPSDASEDLSKFIGRKPRLYSSRYLVPLVAVSVPEKADYLVSCTAVNEKSHNKALRIFGGGYLPLDVRMEVRNAKNNSVVQTKEENMLGGGTSQKKKDTIEARYCALQLAQLTRKE